MDTVTNTNFDHIKAQADIESEDKRSPVPTAHGNSTATVEITLDVEATGRVIAAVPETPPAYAHGGLPPEPAHVEDLRITMRVPARCVRGLDAKGYVTVDLTDLVCQADSDAAVDALIDEHN